MAGIHFASSREALHVVERVTKAKIDDLQSGARVFTPHGPAQILARVEDTRARGGDKLELIIHSKNVAQYRG